MRPPKTGYSWKQIGAQFIVIAVVAFAAANLATRAAFPEASQQDLARNSENGFWQTTQQHEQNDQPTTRSVVTANAQKEESAETPPLPANIDAESFLVADLKTGEILGGRDIKTARPVASITKLLTAVVAHETIGDNQTIEITPSAVRTYGSAGQLEAGTTLPLETLYYPLLLSSSNDAAAAIAQNDGRQQFLSQMNRKAFAIGMGQAQFADASGLSAHNVASPQGLLKLTQYIHKQSPFILSMTESAQKTVPTHGASEATAFTNNHPLHSEPGFLGGKNGYTDQAQHTLLSVFAIEKHEERRPVAIIVLGSDKHVADTKALLEWVQSL